MAGKASEASRQILAKTREMMPSERKKFSRILEDELSKAVERSQERYEKENQDVNTN